MTYFTSLNYTSYTLVTDWSTNNQFWTAFATAANHMIVPKLVYGESHLNPADGPSRGRSPFPSTTASNAASTFPPTSQRYL
ncbi:hypothetical protein B0H19DRAFT_1273451 [Mycena capillaripes]|nr:hypothetical protein B0H19DRAFT_1273451 [Mycena capillaripes]